MPVQRFPDPETADETGLLALGGDLEPETLLLAYRNGIFPWPIDGMPLPWFSPPERGVLEFDRLHIPRSLERARRNCAYRFTLDRDFEGVIQACAEASRPPLEGSKKPAGTWITPELRAAYIRLHRLGFAHSCEAWEGDSLVGGIYGVSIDGCFAGESMFRKRDNASKLALLHLVEHLRSRGLDWIDIQMVTPHLEGLGAREIPRPEFLKRLQATRARGLRLFDSPSA